jgi:hypothetical protein
VNQERSPAEAEAEKEASAEALAEEGTGDDDDDDDDGTLDRDDYDDTFDSVGWSVDNGRVEYEDRETQLKKDRLVDACRHSERMFHLATNRQNDIEGKREKVYRQQHDRCVRIGKTPETREAFDARWDRNQSRFMANAREQVRKDITKAAEAGVRVDLPLGFADDG